MKNWRDQILCEFTPQIARLTLVAVSERLDVLRHGLEQDLIMLRTENLPAAKEGRCC